MEARILTETSIIPALTFLAPMLFGTLVLAFTRIDRRLQQGLPIVSAAWATALGAWMANQILHGVVLTAWHNELRVDALSALMVVLIGMIGLLASIYSVRYLRLRN